MFFFIWLFSDLHALEVELWIHCFCTIPPFKRSECWQANLCLVWRFFVCFFWFVYLFFFIYHLFPYHHISHLSIHTVLRWVNSVEAWLNAVWNPGWMTLLERSLAQFFRPHWRVGQRHVGSVKKVLIFFVVFFTAPLYLQNIKTICRTQCVKLNLSGHLLWGIIYCHWCWDPDLGCLSTYNHHWLSRRAVSETDKNRKEKVKKTVIIVEIWICLKTLSKMLFVVLF